MGRERRYDLLGVSLLVVACLADGCDPTGREGGAGVAEDASGPVDTTVRMDFSSEVDLRDDTGQRDAALEDAAAGDTTPPDDALANDAGGGTAGSNLCERVGLGNNADLGGENLFPADSYWNRKVENAPVDPNSDAIIDSIGANTGLHPDFGCCYMGTFGIPYTVVDESTPEVPVSFRYADESDPGPYPIPPDAPIEGGEEATGDRHVLVLDCAERKLYEIFDAHKQSDGSWQAGSGTIWDLDEEPVREPYCTSADAAGLPLLPGLARYDEASAGKIDHALRFTVEETRKAFVRPPASHWASDKTSSDLPPMGMRVRLKSDADLKADGVDPSQFHPQVAAVVDALQTYGMILADNGSDWYVSGMPHRKWNDGKLVGQLEQIKGKHFEVVEMKNVVDDRSVGSGSCQLGP